MKPLHRRLLWSLYILVAAVFFAYRLFPAEIVGRCIEAQANRLHPDFRVEISEAKLRFPSGIMFESLKVSHRDRVVLNAADMRIGAGIMTAFAGGFPFSARIFDGRISGKVYPEPNGASIEGTFSEIQVSRASELENLTSHKLSGAVGGKFAYRMDSSKKNAGEIELKAVDAAIVLQPPFFDLDQIRFRSLEANLNLNGDELEFSRCELKGSDLDARFTGAIFLKNPIGASIIKVSGTIQPHPVFLSKVKQLLPVQLLNNRRNGQEGLTIRLYNTLEAPRFSFR